MPRRTESAGTIRAGLGRGTYEWHLGNLRGLKRDEVMESSIFEIGDYKWKLALLRGFRNSHPPEMVRVFLFSCNDDWIHTYVSIAILNKRKAIGGGMERKPRTTGPFQYIDRCAIPFEDLMNSSAAGLENKAEFIVAIDLKNVRAATPGEQRASSRGDMRTIHLEMITDESIVNLHNGTNNDKKTFGIAQLSRKRHSDVPSCSFVVPWADCSPDNRYWLCERSADGYVTVKRCLSEAGLFETFKDMSVEVDGGCSWVTLFAESKKSHEEFKPINKNSIVVFCKFLEPPHEDITYIGHLILQDTATCRELSQRIADEVARLEDPQGYRAYLEEQDCIREITHNQSQLNECGVHSGSSIILRKLESNSHSEPENVQQDLCRVGRPFHQERKVGPQESIAKAARKNRCGGMTVKQVPPWGWLLNCWMFILAIFSLLILASIIPDYRERQCR